MKVNLVSTLSHLSKETVFFSFRSSFIWKIRKYILVRSFPCHGGDVLVDDNDDDKNLEVDEIDVCLSRLLEHCLQILDRGFLDSEGFPKLKT